jgi:hypothetical protein
MGRSGSSQLPQVILKVVFIETPLEGEMLQCPGSNTNVLKTWKFYSHNTNQSKKNSQCTLFKLYVLKFRVRKARVRSLNIVGSG